ncbi:unnamed protein product [Cyprideis torosa]|uniref:Carboxylic ester hydrolase n=1 Tax=Cyprideis torosa TaxID=163714 RepID=A0A7R8WFF9_9CRUS|nr:unnamed protein product [Cyprideis torosa]CAG0896916.1 unnamed protein product [Cyprideis torosa]
MLLRKLPSLLQEVRSHPELCVFLVIIMFVIPFFAVIFVYTLAESLFGTTGNGHEAAPEISLRHGGRVRGVRKPVILATRETHPENRQYDAYKSIPYGQAPIRFTAPVAHPGWSDVRDSSEDGPPCFQEPMYDGSKPAVGVEDCLSLNVFVPVLRNSSKPLPVIAWIHGGGFGAGRTNWYGPDNIMAAEEHPVILVTIQYRLATLGFLSTGDSEAAGNWGMLDMVLALQWVQDNIGQFGGDAGRVTIGGESAGSAAVSLLTLSPLAKGLFHRAIGHSGTSVDPWAINEDPLDSASRLATALGCDLSQGNSLRPRQQLSQSIVKCLREADARDIIDKQQEIIVRHGTLSRTMVPTVDGRFLPLHPRRLLETGRIASKVPYATGITEEEGITTIQHFALMHLRSLENSTLDYVNKQWNVLCDGTSQLGTPLRCEELREYFLGPSLVDTSNLRVLAQIYGEYSMEIGFRKHLEQMSKWMPAFAFILEYGGSTHFLESSLRHLYLTNGEATLQDIDDARKVIKDLDLKGASHGHEMVYLFSGPWHAKMDPDSKDFKMVQKFVELWTYFAHNGDFEDVVPDWKMWTLGSPRTCLLSPDPRISYTRTRKHMVYVWEEKFFKRQHNEGV